MIGGLRASSDPIFMLDEPGLGLLRLSLEISTPDRPRTLAHSLGDAVTPFGRGTFNLTGTRAEGLAPHSYSATQAGDDLPSQPVAVDLREEVGG